jgi:hypothetical protein
MAGIVLRYAASAARLNRLLLDGRTGKLLWKASLGGRVNSGPMSFAVKRGVDDVRVLRQ